MLAGAPALVMAVDRRVRVRLHPAASGAATVHARQLGVDREPVHWTSTGLQGGAALERLGMTRRLLPLLARGCGISPQRMNRIRIEIDSAELFAEASSNAHSANGVKLGLGSSGAVSAALACAFETLADQADLGVVQRWLRWLPCYREALGSDASGADLAASLGGGLQLLWPCRDEPSRLQARPWPEGLCWRAVWVGTPAQTVDYVAAFQSWREREPAAARRLIAELSRRVEAVVASDAAQDWLDSFQAYAERLEPLGAAIGRAVMSRPHLQLRALARRHAVVYKSCGAGGGDLGIALSNDAAGLDAFCRAAWSLNAYPLDLQADTRGASARWIESTAVDSPFLA